MKNIYITIAILFYVSLSSCVSELDSKFDGRTAFEEKVDYSKFYADISDNITKIISNVTSRAAFKNHIGYALSDKPDLFLYVDGQDDPLLYKYDTQNSLCYLTTEEVNSSLKPIYMISPENSEGGIVGALWPSESVVSKNNSIKLRNLKSRVNISYKRIKENSAVDDIINVKIGNIYTKGSPKVIAEGSVLYKPDLSQKETTVDLLEVIPDTKTIFDDDKDKDLFKFGSFECFVVPQTFHAYKDFIEFDVNGEKSVFYFKNDFVIDSDLFYSFIFEINEVDGKVIIELTDVNSVPAWESGINLPIEIDVNNPNISEWDGKGEEEFKSGNGSPDHPYLIENANQLKFFMENISSIDYYDKFFKLSVNIDWGGNTWSMSSNTKFKGEFDGNNKVIKNINSSTGLFTQVNGSIKNLKVTGNIDGHNKLNPAWGQDIGGIAGSLNRDALIENCSFKGTVKGNYNVGGIAGNCSGSIKGCVVYNSEIQAVNAQEQNGTNYEASCGGIVGKAWDGSGIYKCLSRNNTLKGSSSGTGGILGKKHSNWNSYVENCFTFGLKTLNEDYIYGTAGVNFDKQWAVTTPNCYHTYQESKIVQNGNGTNAKNNFYISLQENTMEQVVEALNNTEGNQGGEGEWKWIYTEGAETPVPVKMAVMFNYNK